MERQVKIIVINGSGGCGKSTFISKCMEVANVDYPNLIIVESSTVDYPKEVGIFCRWNGTKTDNDRAFLHDLKIALEKWDNSPNEYVFTQIRSITTIYSEHDLIFFVNIREPDCIDSFIEQCKNEFEYDIQTVLVINPNVELVTSNDGDNSVFDYCYDYNILNSGTLDDLTETAKTFLLSIF